MNLESILRVKKANLTVLGVSLASLLTVGGCNDKKKPGNPDPTALNRSATLLEDTFTSVNLQGSGTAPFTYNVFGAGPSNGALSVVNDIATYTPNPDFFGVDSFQYTVTNAGGITSPPATVTLNVTGTPDDPVINVIGATTVSEGGLLYLQFDVTEADGDTPLTLAGSGIPTGATFDGPSRTLIWTPNYADAGNYPLSLTADDGNGGITTINPTIIIADTPVIESIVTNSNEPAGGAFLFNIYSIDQFGSLLGPEGNGVGVRPRFLPISAGISHNKLDGAVQAGFIEDGVSLPLRVTDNLTYSIRDMAFSPDESVVAYMDERDQRIYLADWDGLAVSNIRRLTTDITLSSEDLPAFSPDGRWVYYQVKEESPNTTEVYRRKVDLLTAAENITNNPANDGSPALSADGTKMAFRSDRADGLTGQIYLADADGTNPLQKTFVSPGSGDVYGADYPAFSSTSAEGKKLFYAEIDSNGGLISKGLIHTLHFDSAFNPIVDNVITPSNRIYIAPHAGAD